MSADLKFVFQPWLVGRLRRARCHTIQTAGCWLIPDECILTCKNAHVAVLQLWTTYTLIRTDAGHLEHGSSHANVLLGAASRHRLCGRSDDVASHEAVFDIQRL